MPAGVGPKGLFPPSTAFRTVERTIEEAIIERPHVLWVEIGFGIAIALFAAIVVAGQQISTAVYVAMLLIFLAAFVLFAVFAEGAAHRAEHRGAEGAATRRFGQAASRRQAPTGL